MKRQKRKYSAKTTIDEFLPIYFAFTNDLSATDKLPKRLKPKGILDCFYIMPNPDMGNENIIYTIASEAAKLRKELDIEPSINVCGIYWPGDGSAASIATNERFPMLDIAIIELYKKTRNKREHFLKNGRLTNGS